MAGVVIAFSFVLIAMISIYLVALVLLVFVIIMLTVATYLLSLPLWYSINALM